MKQVTIENKTVKIGDVFVNSWGYEQTNIDFSMVVGFTTSGKSVRIVPIGQSVYKKIHDMAEKVIPNRDNITGKSKTVRLGVWHGHIEAGRGNWDWNGVPCMQTSYA